MPFLSTKDGTRLFYNDWGSGTPLVLIHGWPLDADMWEYQATALGRQGIRVIAYDRRGFGRSDQPWSGYDYDTLADDLAAVIDTLDLQGATIAGFSMGGGEVARYLSRHGSARVAKAVLISAVTPYLVQTPNNEEGVPRSVFDQIIEGLEADRPHFLAAFGKQFFGAGLLNFTISNEMLEWAGNLALLGSKKATLHEEVDPGARALLLRDGFSAGHEVLHGSDADHPRRCRRDGADRQVRATRRADDPDSAAAGV